MNEQLEPDRQDTPEGDQEVTSAPSHYLLKRGRKPTSVLGSKLGQLGITAQDLADVLRWSGSGRVKASRVLSGALSLTMVEAVRVIRSIQMLVRSRIDPECPLPKLWLDEALLDDLVETRVQWLGKQVESAQHLKSEASQFHMTRMLNATRQSIVKDDPATLPEFMYTQSELIDLMVKHEREEAQRRRAVRDGDTDGDWTG